MRDDSRRILAVFFGALGVLVGAAVMIAFSLLVALLVLPSRETALREHEVVH